MATAARQAKGPRKGPPEPSAARNRAPAWGSGARASPTFSPTNAPAARQQPATAAAPANPTPQANFPPLAQTQGQNQPQVNGGRTDNNAPRDRVLQALSGLTGTTVTLVTKTAQRYEGVIASTNSEGDTHGVTLKDVKDITNPGTPLKDSFFIASTNIESYTSGPADAKPTNGDSFRTDADISQKKPAPGRERDLQAWVPSGDGAHPALSGDDDTFGPSAANSSTAWDQFSANEQLFGVKASFDEDLYTTKLDRSAPDFKERERKAQKIANEIIGAATSNPHIAEERGLSVDDSGVNEEDKYGAVVRGQNAYVPPGARKSGAPFPPSQSAASAVSGKATDAPTQDTPSNVDAIPKVSVNGPDGATAAAAQSQSPSSSKAASPAPSANKPPADPLPAFRDFVTYEKQRLTQKRQALVKNDMDKRMAELVKFSQNFKLNKPIPEDLVPILAKDEDRQRQITEKAKLDAASAQARAIGPSTPTQASRGVAVGVAKNSERKPVSQALAGKGGAAGGAAGLKTGLTTSNVPSPAVTATASSKPASTSTAAATAATATVAAAGSAGSKKISMVIQTIPPFRGGSKAKTTVPTSSNTAMPASSSANGTPAAGASTNANVNKIGVSSNGNATNANANRGPSAAAAQSSAMSPNTAAANRLNINASSFRPNPKANAFNPVILRAFVLTAESVLPSPKSGPVSGSGPNAGASASGGAASHTSSPKPKGDSTPITPNPFFGTRLIKKSTPVHVKDDFNPFKHNKVVDASQVSALWPYSGKRYMQMFPPPQHPPPQHAHMMPPVPPPMPPPTTYEEDSAAPAAAQQHRGYVYAYPPYGYAPQHMMQGMAPPGPPGAYMPGPYMQPMPYPPGMPPPNAMYSPGMGQMPPPQAYMQPPPGYPPPPNGAGPRPSMPPTPIPAHAHPYYHQSPQLQHAYPMMMPPPPNIPPHGYEGGPAPPVPMGGHA
ncbi:hypothetical protein BDZ97DRAFT_1913428 [Flammula alnicola]|nr:hypothetical protein BDZ97DRAFT_1913428 [Flammula alnicola]